MTTIFADVPSEGNSLDIDKSFERLSQNKDDKTASASQSEKKDTVKEPSQKGEPTKDNTSDEKTPFHKHPRWISTQQELKEYKQKLAEYDSKFKDLEKNSKQEPLPQWWKERYGEDDKSKEQYRNYAVATQAERDRIKNEVKEDIQKEFENEKTQAAQGETYVKEQLSEMKDEGLDFQENELLKFMVDFQKDFGSGSLLDAEGNYDFRKSLALMQKMQPKQADTSVETKKRIAAQSVKSKVSAQQSGIPVVTRRSLRGNWRDSGI